MIADLVIDCVAGAVIHTTAIRVIDTVADFAIHAVAVFVLQTVADLTNGDIAASPISCWHPHT